MDGQDSDFGDTFDRWSSAAVVYVRSDYYEVAPNGENMDRLEPGSPHSNTLRVLGPFHVGNSPRNLAPTAPKMLQVLALLCLSPGKLVPTDTIIDELWGDSPPASATGTTHTYIYHLRRDLRRQGLTLPIVTRPHGYVLEMDAAEVDAFNFEELIARGRQSMDQGDHVEADELLSSALALWRGPALVDVVHGRALRPETLRLGELHLAAQRMRIRARVEAGRYREVISELRAVVVGNPYDEWLHSTLMEALSRSGRRHEALQVYRELRRCLSEDLGIEPNGQVQRVLRTVLHGDQPDTETA